MRAHLIADAPLMLILTGGIFTDQAVGVEGFRREAGSPTESAFDADDFIKPCALIKEGNTVPFGNVRSDGDGFIAVSQTVFVYLYEMRGHDQIDLARERIKVVLKNKRLGRSYTIMWAFDSLPIPDSGPLLNSTSINQVWQVVSTRLY